MNIFNSFMRDILERKEGRIRRCAGHWKLAPEETRENGSYPIPGKEGKPYLESHTRVGTDKLGQKMHLVSKMAVHCPNPEYIDQFASLKNNIVFLSVPESFCRKCSHYRSAKRSRRKYATCGYAASENAAAETLGEFQARMQEAAEKANELLS
jgi:hypothetical protein